MFLGETRPILVEERKTQIKDLIELYGKFLTFKQTTTVVGGDADLSDQTTKYYGMGDLVISDDEDEYSIFPVLQIQNDIKLLGNYFSTNYKNVKSFTKIELKADLLEIYLEAQLRVQELWLDGDVTDAGGMISYSYCNIPDPLVLPPPITFHEQFKLDILQAYRDSFEVFDKEAT